jgi:hypothetical protein
VKRYALHNKRLYSDNEASCSSEKKTITKTHKTKINTSGAKARGQVDLVTCKVLNEAKAAVNRIQGLPPLSYSTT